MFQFVGFQLDQAILFTMVKMGIVAHLSNFLGLAKWIGLQWRVEGLRLVSTGGVLTLE
jgi:hypothetical protein